MDLRPGIASIGPLLPKLNEAFGISYAQAAFLTSIPPFLMGLLALPAPLLAHRFGRNRMIIAAMILITLATAARALSGTSLVLFLTTAGVGMGIAVAGALIGGFVKSNYPRQAALFMGLYAMSLGLGATISAALTGPLSDFAQDWRVGAGVWVLPGVTAIAAWCVIARRESALAAVVPVAAPRAALPVRSGAAWRIAFYFAANNILFFGFLTWLVPLYLDRGQDTATAGLILTSFTIAFMCANPLPGLIGGGKDRRVQIGMAAAIALAGILGVALLPGTLTFLFVPAVAVGVGSSFTLGMTLPLDHTSSPQEANAWNALVLAFGYGLGALGPLLVGLLYTWSGGFGLPLLFLGGTAVLMLGMTPLLRGDRPAA
ncbi:CynX/NimT family MFS transporter [Halodurantibacterium flavum]